MANTNPGENPLDSDGSGPWLEVLHNALRLNISPEVWPDTGSAALVWRELIQEMLSICQFAKQMAEGDLNGDLIVHGRLAGNLKALQANLRHLTWQVQQVADGNLSQHVEFLGDFSIAFNQMVSNLAQARTALQISEARYRSVVEASPDDITIIDTQGIIQLISPAAVNMFGFESAAEAITKCQSAGRL